MFSNEQEVWLTLYKAALLELDLKKMPERIALDEEGIARPRARTTKVLRPLWREAGDAVCRTEPPRSRKNEMRMASGELHLPYRSKRTTAYVDVH